MGNSDRSAVRMEVCVLLNTKHGRHDATHDDTCFSHAHGRSDTHIGWV